MGIKERCMSLRFLVVEDDPASCEFVRSTLQPVATIDTARSLAEAGALCAEHSYSLLLLDVSLPDGQGDAWLARQRALGNRSPAIALTADLDRDRRRQLLASGFDEALGKPIGAQTLLEAIRPWLPRQATAAWSDGPALAAVGGSQATLAKMRSLFLAELTVQRDAIVGALGRGDSAALRATLHQMRAGCGFVGAVALGEAVDALHKAPENHALASTLLAGIDAMLGNGHTS